MGEISSSVGSANYQTRFRPIWQSSLTSELGGALFTFCNSILIYQLTGSAAALGLVWLIYYVPSFFMQLFIGPYIDRWSRKKTMMVCQGIRALLALSLTAMVFMDILVVGILYIFQVVIGLIMPIFTPANQAILPSIVRPDELPKANSSLETVRQVMAVMGPVAGGVVVDYMAIQWILLTVGIAFSLSAYFLLAVREPALPMKERKPWIADFKEGFRTYLSFPLIVWLGVFFGFVQFGVGVTIVTTLPYITTVLDQPYTAYGIFMAGFPIGYILGAMASRKMDFHRGLGILFGALFLGGCTYLNLAFTPWYSLALITEVLAGMVIAVFNIFNITLIQRAIPNSLLGKVTSIRLLIMRLMLPLGILAATVGVGFVSIRGLYFMIGALICLTSLIGYLYLRNRVDVP